MQKIHSLLTNRVSKIFRNRLGLNLIKHRQKKLFSPLNLVCLRWKCYVVRILSGETFFPQYFLTLVQYSIRQIPVYQVSNNTICFFFLSSFLGSAAIFTPKVENRSGKTIAKKIRARRHVSIVQKAEILVR